MKVYTFSQARQNLAEVLNRAKVEKVTIRRHGGEAFTIVPECRVGSPLDVPGVKSRVSTSDILAAVRESRARPSTPPRPGRKRMAVREGLPRDVDSKGSETGSRKSMVAQLSDSAEFARAWTINDRVAGHYFGRVSLKESPLSLRLFWRHDDDSPRKLIGVFRLNLKKLLAASYVREVADRPGEIILRFQRVGAARIQIATKRSGLALDIGKVPV